MAHFRILELLGEYLFLFIVFTTAIKAKNTEFKSV